MKKKILFCLSILSLGLAMGQSVIREMPTLSGKPSIARYWQGRQSILYEQSNAGTGFFVLEDENSVTAILAQMPDGVTITDMEILKDSLFFVGNYQTNTNNYGVVGVFGIIDMFFGSHTCHYGVLFDPTMYPNADTAYQRSALPKRLSLFVSGEAVRMAYVGNHVANGMPNWGIIGSAYFNGTQMMAVAYTNKDADRYTDIAATDHFVVAAGSESTDEACLIRVFGQSGNFVISEMTPGRMFKVQDSLLDYQVRIAALDGDKFAIAHAYYHPRISDGIMLKILSIDWMLNTIVINHALVIPQTPFTGAPWRVTEIRYMPMKNYLLMLHDRDFAMGSISALCKFDITRLMSGLVDCTYFDHVHMHSVDACPISPMDYQVSGREYDLSHTAVIFREALVSGVSCASDTTLMYDPVHPTLGFKDVRDVRLSTLSGSATLTVSTATINNICEQ